MTLPGPVQDAINVKYVYCGFEEEGHWVWHAGADLVFKYTDHWRPLTLLDMPPKVFAFVAAEKLK